MDKAFDVKMIADFIPTLAGYLPITLYILALSYFWFYIRSTAVFTANL